MLVPDAQNRMGRCHQPARRIEPQPERGKAFGRHHRHRREHDLGRAIAIARARRLVDRPFEASDVGETGTIRQRRVAGEEASQRIAVNVEIAAGRRMRAHERDDDGLEHRVADQPPQHRKRRRQRLAVVGDDSVAVDRDPSVRQRAIAGDERCLLPGREHRIDERLLQLSERCASDASRIRCAVAASRRRTEKSGMSVSHSISVGRGPMRSMVRSYSAHTSRRDRRAVRVDQTRAARVEARRDGLRRRPRKASRPRTRPRRNRDCIALT